MCRSKKSDLKKVIYFYKNISPQFGIAALSEVKSYVRARENHLKEAISDKKRQLY
jgi:hypothetical protein